MPEFTPLISVIVVCRNPGPRLGRALDSVWGQRDAAIDLVVVDGDSTDGTRQWLLARRERIAALISEPDEGIYDAMNKGVGVARGTWVIFLGADDELADGVGAALTPLLETAQSDVLVGGITYEDGRRYGFAGRRRAICRNFVHHQATFYRRSLFAAHGKFQTNLVVMADYEFNLRLLRRAVAFEPVPVQVATCGRGGISDRGRWIGYREEIAVRHRYFPAWRCWVWDVASVIRFFRKKLLR